MIAEGKRNLLMQHAIPVILIRKEYYRKQGIHVKVRADTLEKQSEKSLLYDRIKNEMWKWRKNFQDSFRQRWDLIMAGR